MPHSANEPFSSTRVAYAPARLSSLLSATLFVRAPSTASLPLCPLTWTGVVRYMLVPAEHDQQ
jgi:hypothetical protein